MLRVTLDPDLIHAKLHLLLVESTGPIGLCGPLALSTAQGLHDKAAAPAVACPLIQSPLRIQDSSEVSPSLQISDIRILLAPATIYSIWTSYG